MLNSRPNNSAPFRWDANQGRGLVHSDLIEPYIFYAWTLALRLYIYGLEPSDILDGV